MSKFAPKFFGRFFLPFAYLPAVDHYIMFVGDAVDADRTKCKVFKTHCANYTLVDEPYSSVMPQRFTNSFGHVEGKNRNDTGRKVILQRESDELLHSHDRAYPP